MAVSGQPVLQVPVIRTNGIHGLPEGFRVVHVNQVAAFVSDEVVDDRLGGHHGQPVVLNGAITLAMPPLGFGLAKDDIFELVFNTEPSGSLDGLGGHVFAGLLFKPFIEVPLQIAGF